MTKKVIKEKKKTNSMASFKKYHFGESSISEVLSSKIAF